ncbi:MAG: hypothetical protein JKY61_01020 [Planctomycetes bacterium]|nr:hypothetical protein [Planctomycetota bacterium]
MTGRLESDPELALRNGLEALQGLTLKKAGLKQEWTDAWAQFSQGAPPFEKAQTQGSSACGRFREWFLLERHSPSLLGAPFDRLINEWRESHPDFTEHVEPLLLSSFTGIFEVGDLVEDQGAWVRDITGFGEFALQDRRGSSEMRTGDLLVGRLFSVPGSLHVPSGDATWLRSPDLSEALERDLNRMYGEGAKILRLAAPELEAMFFHPTSPHRAAAKSSASKSSAQTNNAIAEAREFLTLAGWSRTEIKAWFKAIKSARFDPKSLAANPTDPVGQALEQFAFNTKIDLSEARRILTQAWMASKRESTKTEASDERPAESSEGARDAVNRFAAAQAAGNDMEMHFQDLEQSLGLPVDPEDEDPGTAPDFPGVIGAMVAEFKWDMERQGKANAKWIERLRPFAEYTRTIGAFEDLSRREVLSFCCFWSLEQGLLQEAGTALETIQALEQFIQWALEEHDMPLHEECKTLLGDLRTSLPRVVTLNQQLEVSPASSSEDPGQLFSVGKTMDTGAIALFDRGGNQYTSILPAALDGKVLFGDNLRANLDLEGKAQVFCVYPPEASELNS